MLFCISHERKIWQLQNFGILRGWTGYDLEKNVHYLNPFPVAMAKYFGRKSKSPQKYFGSRSGSILFIHPALSRYTANVEPTNIHSLIYCRYKFWNDDPDVSLRFKIQDGRNSPEPAYTETKASILRRRNTLAKMMKQTYGDGNLAREKHWSLIDIPRSQLDEDTRTPYIRR